MSLYGYDGVEQCPVCKASTPHDFRMAGQMACKVCGVVRQYDCVGAFRRCMNCDEWVPAKAQAAINISNGEMTAPPIPEHKCKGR